MVHLVGGERPPVRDDFDHLPKALTTLPIWACWRELRKPNKKGGHRTTRRLVHPITGKEPRSDHPDDWATFEQVLAPKLRNPVDGIGVYLAQESGLAVVFEADLDLPARLGDSVIYFERSAAGESLTVLVKASVLDAVTDVFVPLLGQGPYQEASTRSGDGCWDTAAGPVGTDASLLGQPPYQEIALSGHEPYQAEGVLLGQARILFSCSPPNPITSQETKKTVEEQLSGFAREWVEQNEEGRKHWLYTVITILKANGITTLDKVDAAVLRDFSAIIKKDVGEVWRKVVASWEKWKHHDILLSDAVRAVQADAALLDGLRERVADDKTLLVAGMARFLGAGGRPFVFDQKVLAKVVGLAQQDVSELLAALRELGWLRLYKAAHFTSKKSSEYSWTGPGAVTPAVVSAPAAPTSTPRPMAGPPPSPQQPSNRPGHSNVETPEHRWKSLLGGFLDATHYLAEMMLDRWLIAEGKALFHGFWTKYEEKHEWQIVSAHRLLEQFDPVAICAALRAEKKVYSLAAPGFADKVEAEQAKLDHTRALLADRAKEAATAPLTDVLPAGTRPAFVPRKSTLSALKACGA